MGRNEPWTAGVCAAMRMLLAVLVVLVAACGASPIVPGAVQPVVTVELHGGLCADGECRSAFVIRSDGTVVDPAQPMVTATADPVQFARLLSAINNTDLQAMKARPFTGTCPVAFDGQEAIFTFRLPAGDLRLASCESDLDLEHEVFLAIREVLRAAEGPTN